jgi:exodeoxyribonuclease V beta subunit
MIRSLLDGEGVRERLLGCEAGERALTNVLHIAELLGRAEAAEKLGMQGLRKWLAERRDPALPGSDEYQLRLESDEDAVKVMTVHKSKGLEFPIVFCPFAWSRKEQRKGEAVVFHDEDARAVCDIGSSEYDDHSARAAQESLAEEVRLLYVALTRAKNRCYVALAAVRKEEASAMAHLMRGTDGSDMQQGLSDFFERAAGRARVRNLPWETPEPLSGVRAAGPEPLERAFGAAIDRTWGMASYTAFIHGLHRDADAADRDMLSRTSGTDLPEKRERANDIFSFPRGARAGTLLHEVFERIGFADDGGKIRSVTEETLARYGFDAAWTETVTGMVQRVLAVDLGGFSLKEVQDSERLTELEFMVPLDTLTPRDLEEALRGCADGGVPEATPRFHFDPVKGFLRGFMDLVFVHEGRYFLVDWKSNHLGGAVEDYHQDALAEAMAREGYVLQYHLYCVALDRYLHNRLEGYAYDAHFGGVIYVFLRGVDPAKGPEYGIFRARPDGEDVARLAGILMGETS